MLDEIKKNRLLIIVTLIGWIAVIVGATFDFGQDTQKYKALRFDTIEQKRDVIKFSESEFVPRPEIESNAKLQNQKLDLIIKMIDEK